MSMSAILRALVLDRVRENVRTALDEGLKDNEPQSAEIYDIVRDERGTRLERREAA